MAKANKTTPSVKIVDSKLILSLPDALEPVVWQMDLEQAQSAAFTIKENKKAKSFNLVLKVHGEKTEEIASFADKQSAMEVLMETSETLQNAQGKIYSAHAASAQTSAPKSEKGDKLGAFLAAALVIILVFSWIMLSSAPEKLANIKRTQKEYYGTTANGNPRESAGVPVSADDFLSNR